MRVNEEQNYMLLFFDTDKTGRSYEMIVKDLNTGAMDPALFMNVDLGVAVDKHHGFYYTEVDADGSGRRVFRHQMGTTQDQDVMIYDEPNQEFKLSLSNQNSLDFVFINIESTFKPYTNEIWVRNAHSDSEKFWLIQPMKLGVNYQIKHSNEFLYKMSNEGDLKNYEISRIPLPSKLKMLEGNVDWLEEQSRAVATTDRMIARLEKKELMPITQFLTEREDTVMPSLLEIEGVPLP